MEGYAVGIASAMWLGILTSISPCPLATNLAAMSFIGRSIASPGRVMLDGAVYTAGRMLAYAGLAWLLISSVLAVPEVAFFLEMNMNKALGPLLVVVGLILADALPWRFSATLLTDSAQRHVKGWGLPGACLLGVLFALSFCPVSAALYFGSLLPLAAAKGSAVTIPLVYGVGTALPVFVFAVLLAFGAQRAGKAFKRLVPIEKWARRITAAVLILVGIKFVLNYIFEVQI